MEPKRNKYDTNPLDEKVADHADQSFGSTHPGPPTEEVRGGPTRDIARTANEAARLSPESEAGLCPESLKEPISFENRFNRHYFSHEYLVWKGSELATAPRYRLARPRATA